MGAVYGLDGQMISGAGMYNNGGHHVLAYRSGLEKRRFVGSAQDWWGIGSGAVVDRQISKLESTEKAMQARTKDQEPQLRSYVGRESPLYAPESGLVGGPDAPSYSPSSHSDSVGELTYPVSPQLIDPEFYDWAGVEAPESHHWPSDMSGFDHEIEEGWGRQEDAVVSGFSLDDDMMVKVISRSLSAVGVRAVEGEDFTNAADGVEL